MRYYAGHLIWRQSRINSIENTLKSLSLIKTEPSSPRRLTTSLSSNKAAPISNYNTRAPYPQNPTIASQSMQSFPKLEYTETLVPALPQRINYARPPRCPRSTSAIHPTRPLHLDSADPSNSTVRKQHRTYTRRPTSPDPTGKLSVTQKINHFTRELWDTRREISAAQAREKALEMSLQSLNPGDGSIAKPVSDIIESKAARGVFIILVLPVTTMLTLHLPQNGAFISKVVCRKPKQPCMWSRRDEKLRRNAWKT